VLTEFTTQARESRVHENRNLDVGGNWVYWRLGQSTSIFFFWSYLAAIVGRTDDEVKSPQAKRIVNKKT